MPHRQIHSETGNATRHEKKKSDVDSTSSATVCPSCISSANTQLPFEASSMSASPEGECLQCSKAPLESGIQVSCDDCDRYICNDCHWCHDFQANHEIRVCDRCHAFYCRSCDEMDLCEDCNEVVCGNCSTLMSCKFCGCGLCEDCATACGR